MDHIFPVCPVVGLCCLRLQRWEGKKKKKKKTLTAFLSFAAFSRLRSSVSADTERITGKLKPQHWLRLLRAPGAHAKPRNLTNLTDVFWEGGGTFLCSLSPFTVAVVCSFLLCPTFLLFPFPQSWPRKKKVGWRLSWAWFVCVSLSSA